MIYLMLCGAAFSGLPIHQEPNAMVYSYSLEDFLYGKSFAVVEDESFAHALAAGRAFARPANQRKRATD